MNREHDAVGLWWDDSPPTKPPGPETAPNFVVVEGGVTIWLDMHTVHNARTAEHKSAVLAHKVAEYRRLGHRDSLASRALIRERLRLANKSRMFDQGRASARDVELVQVRIEIMELMPHDTDPESHEAAIDQMARERVYGKART